jgi:hypothetical protein
MGGFGQARILGQITKCVAATVTWSLVAVRGTSVISFVKASGWDGLVTTGRDELTSGSFGMLAGLPLVSTCPHALASQLLLNPF